MLDVSKLQERLKREIDFSSLSLIRRVALVNARLERRLVAKQRNEIPVEKYFRVFDKWNDDFDSLKSRLSSSLESRGGFSLAAIEEENEENEEGPDGENDEVKPNHNKKQKYSQAKTVQTCGESLCFSSKPNVDFSVAGMGWTRSSPSEERIPTSAFASIFLSKT